MAVTVKDITWLWFMGGVNVNTLDFYVPKAYVHAQTAAQTALYFVMDGDGSKLVGIKGYRRSLVDASGVLIPGTPGSIRDGSWTHEDFDFGDWPVWPAAIANNQILSVTFAIIVGGDDNMAGLVARIEFLEGLS